MTAYERAVLAHVVIEPEAWLAHAAAVFGEERAAKMLAAKVARHLAEYEAASAEPAYLTRAERERPSEG